MLFKYLENHIYPKRLDKLAWASSVNPDQNSTECNVWSASTLFVIHQENFYTNDPLYTDARYNDIIRYDILNVTKPSPKRKWLVTNYTRLLYLLL